MQIENVIEFLEENDVNDAVLSKLGVRNVGHSKDKIKNAARTIRLDQIDIQVQHRVDLEMLESGFNFSYIPSRHEASWLFSSIGQFYADQ